MRWYYFYDSPLGVLTIGATAHAITDVRFGKVPLNTAVYGETALIKRLSRQLQEYFAGNRRDFDIPFSFDTGTEFERRVWHALRSVPYGKTASYGDIAKRINNPKACRAVGRANNHNPIAICFPCHRIIGANGALVGYGGGLDKKRFLLALENPNLSFL